MRFDFTLFIFHIFKAFDKAFAVAVVVSFRKDCLSHIVKPDVDVGRLVGFQKKEEKPAWLLTRLHDIGQLQHLPNRPNLLPRLPPPRLLLHSLLLLSLQVPWAWPQVTSRVRSPILLLALARQPRQTLLLCWLP
jgi:hypothetical protein